MKKYEFNATNLIAETFEERGIHFDVVSRNGREQLLAGFSVDCGPNVVMRFISRDDDNDVAARIYGLISNTPKEKRGRVLEACNTLNHKVRFMKFYLDGDNDINVEYDFPMRSPDNGIGEMAFEIFVRTMQILDSEYGTFVEALYGEEKDDSSELQKLQELRKKMAERIAAAGDSAEDAEPESDELDFEETDAPDEAED